MPDLPTSYTEQVAKLRRSNTLFMLTGAAFVAMLLIILIAVGTVNAGKVARQNDAQSKLIVEQTEKNRQRGDTLVCIIGIPATLRTQTMIDACFKKYGLNRNDFVAPAN